MNEESDFRRRRIRWRRSATHTSAGNPLPVPPPDDRMRTIVHYTLLLHPIPRLRLCLCPLRPALRLLRCGRPTLGLFPVVARFERSAGFGPAQVGEDGRGAAGARGGDGGRGGRGGGGRGGGGGGRLGQRGGAEGDAGEEGEEDGRVALRAQTRVSQCGPGAGSTEASAGERRTDSTSTISNTVRLLASCGLVGSGDSMPRQCSPTGRTPRCDSIPLSSSVCNARPCK